MLISHLGNIARSKFLDNFRPSQRRENDRMIHRLVISAWQIGDD